MNKIRRGQGKVIAAFLLAFAMLFQSKEVIVLANTVSGNEFTAQEETIVAGENTSVSENDFISENAPADENTVSGQELAADIRAGEFNPANPVHHCSVYANRDYTDWDYVYFGSYPNTEITDASVIAAIEAAIQNSSVPKTSETDVWINGVKYRRIGKEDVNNENEFGDGTYRYFKWERIKWKVLKNDGNTLMLIADKALDCQSDYNIKLGLREFTWNSSSIRDWLNHDFYNAAFSQRERDAIQSQELKTGANPEYGTDGGYDTYDAVYLLTCEDTINEQYGYCNSADSKSVSRLVGMTDFAHARGVYEEEPREGMYYNGVHCDWWLRSPGKSNFELCRVSNGGVKYTSSAPINCVGVCPVICLDATSSVWLLEDDGTCGDGGEIKTLAKLQVTKSKTMYEKGEALTLNDLKVTAVYQNDEKTVLKSGAYATNASEINMNIPGTKKLTVSYTEEGIVRTAAVSITVKEPAAVTKLTITGPSKKLAAGKKVNLTLQVLPENAANKSVVWKSSNKKYATVNSKGKVTVKKAGVGKTVTITATAQDGSGVKATYKFKIMKHAVKSIKLTASKKTLKAGKSMTIKTSIKTTGKSVNKTLKWSSSNTKYATVNSKGKVIAKKAGKGKTVTITAMSTDGSNKKAKVKIKIK